MKSNIYRFLFLLVLALSLAACPSGGSANSGDELIDATQAEKEAAAEITEETAKAKAAELLKQILSEE